MPELPEVETTLNGIRPYLQGQTIQALQVRERRLRWPVPRGLEARLCGQVVVGLYRRGKYIVIQIPSGGCIVHLGMSGSMRVLLQPRPPQTHDHFDLITQQNIIVRYRDPRRFGCLLWGGAQPLRHKHLRDLGIEPLAAEFDGEWLYRAARGRRVAVKTLIMNARVVVGVGNIYAAEALFDAGIHPCRASYRIARQRYAKLADAIKRVLQSAIEQGGTTLQDFVQTDGSSGYFARELNVYGRARLPCRICRSRIKSCVLGQRSTFYCPTCQR